MPDRRRFHCECWGHVCTHPFPARLCRSEPCTSWRPLSWRRGAPSGAEVAAGTCRVQRDSLRIDSGHSLVSLPLVGHDRHSSKCQRCSRYIRHQFCHDESFVGSPLFFALSWRCCLLRLVYSHSCRWPWPRRHPLHGDRLVILLLRDLHVLIGNCRFSAAVRIIPAQLPVHRDRGE